MIFKDMNVFSSVIFSSVTVDFELSGSGAKNEMFVPEGGAWGINPLYSYINEKWVSSRILLAAMMDYEIFC